MAKIAPFASTVISLSLGSITGLKYKTLNCVECGNPILERNSDRMFRLNAQDQPELARPSVDGTISVKCGKCSQKYSLVISFSATPSIDMPLYMQPQSLFITAVPDKKLRDTYCMECGKAFYSISDRIQLLSDNTMPFDMLDPAKLGPMEVWCKFQHCKQRWSVMT